MFKLTKENLTQVFMAAQTEKAKFVGISVTVPGSNALEIIINPNENFEIKRKYYEEAYNDDLTHKNAPLEIVGMTYGNTFSSIQKDLLG